MGLPNEITIRLIPATTLDDAEAMRVIRNDCRTFMTRDTHEISVEEQKLWFATLEHSTTRPFVLVLEGRAFDLIQDRYPEHVFKVGYGLIRQIDRKWWVSGGLLPEWRGKGIGKKLFAGLADLVNADGKTCWLEVRATNSRAIAVYRSLGFELAETFEALGETLLMRRLP